jgi:hypothetical protein
MGLRPPGPQQLKLRALRRLQGISLAQHPGGYLHLECLHRQLPANALLEGEAAPALALASIELRGRHSDPVNYLFRKPGVQATVL